MASDPISALYKFITDQRAEAVESVLSGSLSPTTYPAICKRISTLDEIAAKIKELVGNPAAPGDDV